MDIRKIVVMKYFQLNPRRLETDISESNTYSENVFYEMKLFTISPPFLIKICSRFWMTQTFQKCG